MSNGSTSPTKQQPQIQIGEVTIELGDKKNSNFDWRPTKAKYRGKWMRVNLVNGAVHQDFAQMPDIPGIHISINPAKKTAKVTDPLNEERNRNLTLKIKGVVKNCFKVDQGPMQDVLVDNMSPTDIKTWLYWMRRYIDCGYATEVFGKIPSMETIESLEGRIRIGQYDPSAASPKFKELQEASND